MNQSREEVLSQLRQMDEYEFEHLVADMWEQRGWKTTVTTGSNDRGIDVIAQKNSPFKQKQLIQAKRYSAGNKIGSPDIQQYSSLRQQESDVDAVVVVTTSSFTAQAQQTANDLNVKLIDGNDLYGMILDLDYHSIFSDYLEPNISYEQENDSKSSSTPSTGTRGGNENSKKSNKTGPGNDSSYDRYTKQFGNKAEQFQQISSEKYADFSEKLESWYQDVEYPESMALVVRFIDKFDEVREIEIVMLSQDSNTFIISSNNIESALSDEFISSLAGVKNPVFKSSGIFRFQLEGDSADLFKMLFLAIYEMNPEISGSATIRFELVERYNN